MSNGTSEQLRLGFLAAIEVDGRGHVGGLLVTNHIGRPLEFQCTTPVRPDRTQVILYGNTLRPWLLGELIGKTLVDRVSIKPQLIITADADFLELRNHTVIPVACTVDETAASTDPPSNASVTAELGGRKLRFHEAHRSDSEFITEQSKLIPNQADLEEPLERVHDALNETVRTVMSR